MSEKIETNFQKVPLFWQDFSATNEIATIGSHKECLENRLYGITLYQEEETHSYLIGLETKGRILQTKYEQFVIGAQTWLTLTTQGIMPEAMIQMYRKFYNEWLPVTDYEYDYNADIEVYPMYLEETNDYELWLPIKRKKEV